MKMLILVIYEKLHLFSDFLAQLWDFSIQATTYNFL